MPKLRLGNLVIDRDRQCVFVGNQATELTSTELGLLWHMARYGGRVLTRERLWRAVWGREVKGPTRTLDSHIARLRRKLGQPWMIRAVPRRGYVLTDRPTAARSEEGSMPGSKFSGLQKLVA